jgi:hypothetical protein
MTPIALVLVASLCCAAPVDDPATVGAVRVVVPENAGAVARSAARVFARRIEQRCDARVTTQGEAPFTVELAIDPSLKLEGFQVADRAGGIRITSGGEAGLLYGLGKFLRSSRFDRGGFTPGTYRGHSDPVGTVRGVYLATHFNNFYEAAPAGELACYVEDLALWGTNALMVCFPHWQYDGFDDPLARKSIERLKQVMRAAKAVGMKVGLVETANGGFRSTPKRLRSTPVPDPLGRHGNFGVNLCPDVPDAHALLLANWRRLLEEFGDPGLDLVELWPYDEGGCGCKACWSWGARGYPKLCRDLARLTRQNNPSARVIVSTWTFDTPPDGEWAALGRSMDANGPWADLILADAHEDFPRYPLDTGVPGRLPLLNFPEISMWGQNPWGGYGANPLPRRLQRLWDQTSRKLSGGTPYSEGIYEDLNKAIVAQLYWSPDRPTSETVREYAASEFSPEVVAEAVEAIGILEDNHLRNRIGPSAERAYTLVEQARGKLSPRVQTSWRWRIFYLRCLIDRELLRTKGRLEGETLRTAFDELTTIYHAEHAHSMPIHPPQVKPTTGAGASR